MLAPDVPGSGEGVGESGQPPGSPDGADHKARGSQPLPGRKERAGVEGGGEDAYLTFTAKAGITRRHPWRDMFRKRRGGLYIHTHVYIYIYIHAHIYIYMCTTHLGSVGEIYTHLHTCVWMDIYTRVYVHTRVYRYVCISLLHFLSVPCMGGGVGLCVHVCFPQTRECVDIHTYVHVCTHTHTQAVE